MSSNTVDQVAWERGSSIDRETPVAVELDGHRLWHLGGSIQWAVIDAVVALASMWVGFAFTPSSKPMPDSTPHIALNAAMLVFSSLAFVGSFIFGLSHYVNLKTRSKIIVLVSTYVFAVAVSSLAVINFLLFRQIGRYVLVIAVLTLWMLCLVSRLIWYRWMRQAVHHVLVLGDSYVLGPLEKMLSESTFPIKVVARHVSSDDSETHSPFLPLVEGGCVHEVLVHGENSVRSSVLLSAMDRGIAVSTFESFSERHFFKIPSAFLNNTWFFQVDLRRHHPFYITSKRASDVAFALVGGLVTLPLLGLAILAIKLTSKGPAFYSQIRVGEGQRNFRIWKLRSMRVDSEKSGPQWAKLKDNRVTLVGKILRKTRLDEVPQFWNILIGDMSFIGPRPERPEFVEKLAMTIPFYRQRHLVKPGLTGWAQICYRYGASEEDAREKLSYDLYYLKNASWMLDMQIVLQTIGAVAKGAR
jgi:exopolysaccharide biosynthesis polyprenyl glycosylphosphotransferase